jgi:uncharacterized membrane protein
MKQVAEIMSTFDPSQATGITAFLMNIVASIKPDWAIYGAWPVNVVTNLSFLLGLSLQITFFLLFLTLLSRADLSYVLPVTSFSYILTAILAMVVLKEEISMRRWFGIVLICFGVLLVARGESRTDKKDIVEGSS